MNEQMTAKTKAYGDFCAFQNMSHRLGTLIPNLKEKRILDVGCGVQFPQTLLFHTYGYRICGIDLQVPHIFSKKKSFFFYRRLQRERELQQHIQCHHVYYSELSSLAGRKLVFNGLDIRAMDVEKLPFKDESFSAVISQAVLEHVRSPDKALNEIRRVLIPSSIAWIGIHLFHSLSGGHHPEWQCLTGDVHRKAPPWDHLRDNFFTPEAIHLNKLRLTEYRKLFEERFDIIEEMQTKEEDAERFLTPDIEKELKQYNREELFLTYVNYICRKPVLPL